MAANLALKELRERQGLTQSGLARRLGISRGTVSQWESGASKISSARLEQLSDIFNVDISRLTQSTASAPASAGVGVAEKVCVFLMLVPSAYMHSMSAFVAQNMGAGQPRRAKRALGYGILTAFAAGLVMAWLAFFHGDTLSLLFAKDAAVAAASHSYLKAYAIDCMLTPFLFCFMGYYNGCEKTLFVMIQGVIGAFGVRIPIAYLVSRIPGATLFQIGLGTPASSTVQIVLCLAMFLYLERRQRREALCGAVTGP